MNDLSKKIVEKIKAEHIEPESGWKFSLRRGLTWAAIFGAAILGALSLGLMAVSMLDVDENIFSLRSGLPFTPRALQAVSIPFLVAIAAFLGLAIAGFKNTRYGYRHRVTAVTAALTFVIIAGAAATHYTGLSRSADQSFRRSFPAYDRQMTENRERFWSRPESGFLAGKIDSVRETGFSLTSLDGKSWDVKTDEDTDIRPIVTIRPQELIKIVGEKTGEKTFHAEDIRPWERPGGNTPMGRHSGNGPGNENFSGGMRFKK